MINYILSPSLNTKKILLAQWKRPAQRQRLCDLRNTSMYRKDQKTQACRSWWTRILITILANWVTVPSDLKSKAKCRQKRTGTNSQHGLLEVRRKIDRICYRSTWGSQLCPATWPLDFSTLKPLFVILWETSLLKRTSYHDEMVILNKFFSPQKLDRSLELHVPCKTNTLFQMFFSIVDGVM